MPKNIKYTENYEIPVEKINPFGKDINEDLHFLLTLCIKHIQEPDLNKITKAYYFGQWAYRKLYRKSGEAFFTHPLKVAAILVRKFYIKDNESIIAAILHDTIEDVEGITVDLIEDEFGKEVADLVDGLTKIKGSQTMQLNKAATYGKLFLALIKDIRVILIKLADRLDNMRTLEFLSEDRRKAIAEETIHFYVPFAQRLGLINILKDLEDLSLYFLNKDVFCEIREELKEKQELFIQYIRSFLNRIMLKLNERNVPHILTIEHKHIYEIYRMLEQGTELSDIDNFYSIVINLTTNDYSQAYRAYGIIANVFGPVSSLEDYIARPKVNLYRALHSKHIGPGRKLVEVIIRTEETETILEKGVAGTHSLEKAAKPFNYSQNEISDWIDWMKDIINDGEDDAIQKIWGSIHRNIFDNDVKVHYSGKEYSLPKGSCIIDLAFAVSDEVAFHCLSAKVNKEIKNLDYELIDNDTIELITSSKSEPNIEWENFVITIKAIIKLYYYFKTHDYKPEKIKRITNGNDIKIRFKGQYRQGLLEDIKLKIGKEKISRIYLLNENSILETLIYVHLANEKEFNTIFTKVIGVSGIRSIEKVED